MLKENSKAPAFRLSDSKGTIHTLADLKGKLVILYFYPKDNTPGCTREACGFRDQFSAFTQENAVVYGISKDSESSHAKFIEQYALNFTLLSDPGLVAHKAYQVLDDTKTIRSTFLIDPHGKIVRIWSPVKVDGHIEEVLKAVQQLNNEF